MKVVKVAMFITLIASLNTAQATTVPKPADPNCQAYAQGTVHPSNAETAAKAIPVVFNSTQSPAKNATTPAKTNR